MCDNSKACGCHEPSGAASAATAVSDIGSGIVKGVFAVIGACVAVTLAVGVVRVVLPWLAGGLAVVFAGVCTAGVVVQVRRRRRLRTVIPAPLPGAAPRTTVEAVEVRAIGAVPGNAETPRLRAGAVRRGVGSRP